MDRKKKFFLWKISLTILSFLLAILMKSQINWYNLSNNCFDSTLAKEIIYDISLGIFSSMILIWFIDELNEHIQDKKNRNKEIEDIKRSNRLLQLYIQRYKLFFYCLTTPISKRNFNKVEIHSNFKLKDMQDLYEITLLLNEGILNSSIESFIKAESELKEEMKTIIKSIDFSYYPNIQEHLIKFVEISLKYNQKEAWLKAKITPMGEGTLSDTVSSALKEKADEKYKEFQNGKNLSNSMLLSYFALFEMLKEEYRVLLKYENEIKKLDAFL